jgi:hypothetical protein
MDFLHDLDAMEEGLGVSHTTDPRVERKQIIHFRRHVNQSPHTQVTLVSDGRKDESPPTRVLYTKMGYRKKRKTALYPMVSTVAIKIHHGDPQGTARLGDGGGLGFLPLRLGDFPKVEKLDCFGKCSKFLFSFHAGATHLSLPVRGFSPSR